VCIVIIKKKYNTKQKERKRMKSSIAIITGAALQLLLFLLLSSTSSTVIVVVDGADTGGNTCACEAQRLDFNIDCSNQDAMLAAVGVLEINNCSTPVCSTNPECVKNFLIIQSHHDFCYHEDVPETIERVIHIYEEFCTNHCLINPKFDVEARKCPPVDCAMDGGGVDDAYQTIVNDLNCLSDCSSTDCASSFRRIKAVHDKCPKDTLSWVVEVAYHDYDEVCDEFGCNIAESGDAADELICNDPITNNMSSSTLYTFSAASFIVVGAVSAALFLVY
jgi:hypothetical protein